MEAKLVKDLMEAYASVYAQPEEVIAESDCECEDEEKSEKETPEMNGKKKGKKEKEDEDEMKEGYISEDPVQDYRDMKRAKENAAGMRGPELSHSTKSTGGGSAKQKPQPRSREFSHGGSSQPRSREFAREEVETDLFDVILEYLVAEGYADTNKAALAIMANMSEEWKQNIVEMSPAMQNLMSKPSNRLDGKRSPAPVVGQPPTSGAAGKLLRKPDTTIR